MTCFTIGHNGADELTPYLLPYLGHQYSFMHRFSSSLLKPYFQCQFLLVVIATTLYQPRQLVSWHICAILYVDYDRLTDKRATLTVES